MIEISKAGNDTYKSYGFSTMYEDENVYVNAIVETSNASKFLKQGDVILNIDRINYTKVKQDHYCDILSNGFDNITDQLSITIFRDGKELTFELRKTELL
ncbi:PDZ domain-containing protein [Psychroserpens sp. AS72]|uniref:PDZ domain-containing protein n=1 Tax=Psychroserpens sp. AS72 TaxID=3135775 RepID=UPI00317CD64D